MTQDLADRALLERARAGDRGALESLLERHQAQVYRFSMKMCRDPEDAKDVVQDTLLAMARGVRDFRGASSLSTWIYSIARNYCIKKRHTSKHSLGGPRSLDDEAREEGAAVVDPSKSAVDTLVGREVARALEEAISGLDPASREVLVLRDVEGLTAKEVAEVLGISTQAVKSRLHRARVSVRAGVAPLLGIPLDAPAAPGACPDVLDLFSRHLEDEISPEVCEDMERHLAACGRCRGACDSLKRTLALCRTAGKSVEVPVSVQDSVKVALRDFLAENS